VFFEAILRSFVPTFLKGGRGVHNRMLHKGKEGAGEWRIQKFTWR
jgi:hypothetical protein